MNIRFPNWFLQLGSKPYLWVGLALAVATIDLGSSKRWDWCVLHLTLLLVSLQFVARQHVPRLIAILAIACVAPAILRSPPVWEPARSWVLLALSCAALYHFEMQRRRKQRLAIRQQLQRRVRKRTLQVRTINDALRREIAHRQQTEAKLTRAESHLESLAQRMRLQVIRKDIDGVITYANEAFCQGIGKSTDQVIGSTDADLYPPDLASAYRSDDLRVIESGQPFDHIESHPRPDGGTGWVQVFKAPEYDDRQQVIGIRMVFWDVTDTYRRTAELRRSEARKRALFDAAREAVLLVDEQLSVVEANPAAQTLLAAGNQPLVGQKLEAIAFPEATFPQNPVDVPTAEPTTGQRDTRAQRDTASQRDNPTGPVRMPWTDLPRGQRREVVLRRVGGEGFPAEVSIHPIPLENSSGFAIFIRDVTLRHRAEAALREAKSAAEDASRVKSEFMANVSHEIRTPLGGITGSAELLAQMELTPKAQQYVEMIRDSGELLSGVIGDILDLASIEAGRLKINPQATDLHRCLSEPFRALATKAMGKDLELILHIQPDVPRVALVDANRLRQVVINLAGNAIKFTPKGHVWFRVGIDHLADAKPNRWLRLEMIDSGIGIADDQLRKIFEPFEQGDSGTTRRFGGTGLGLSISDQLIRRMGGTIDVISRPSRGSTFRCLLPLPEMTDGDRAAPTARKVIGSASSRPSPSSVALDIPHPLQRQAIQDLLRHYGFNIDPRGSVRIIDQSLAPQVLANRQLNDRRRIIWLARVDEPAAPKQDPAEPVLIKPIIADDLLDALRQRTGDLPSETSPDHAVRSSAVQGLATPSGDDAAQRARLLVVDDSRVNRTVIHDYLWAAGYAIESVSDGNQAIDAAAVRRFDCVLMDLQMPGMDGIEAMRRVREQYRAQGVTPPPFVALSAHATREHRDRCLQEGMCEFLVKPIDREKLLATVAQQIDHDRPWRDRLLKVAGGDTATFECLIDAFLAEVPDLCDELTAAIANHDAAVAKRAAHTLKSCLRYVAPESDYAPVIELETSIGREDWGFARDAGPQTIAIANRWTQTLSRDRPKRSN